MSVKTPDNIKFWTFLAGMILLVACAILFIDMAIKTAILQESNALRLVIEGEYNDRAAKTNRNGSNNHRGDTGPVLGKFPTGMETGDVANGTKKAVQSRKARGQRSQPGAPMDSGEIPQGD